MKDEGNLELKRKIVTGLFEPVKIALANEVDFYTKAKRDKILEKQKQYIAEFTVDKAIVSKPIEPENEEITEKPKMEEEVVQSIEPPNLK